MAFYKREQPHWVFTRATPTGLNNHLSSCHGWGAMKHTPEEHTAKAVPYFPRVYECGNMQRTHTVLALQG